MITKKENCSDMEKLHNMMGVTQKWNFHKRKYWLCKCPWEIQNDKTNNMKRKDVTNGVTDHVTWCHTSTKFSCLCLKSLSLFNWSSMRTGLKMNLWVTHCHYKHKWTEKGGRRRGQTAWKPGSVLRLSVGCQTLQVDSRETVVERDGEKNIINYRVKL